MKRDKSLKKAAFLVGIGLLMLLATVGGALAAAPVMQSSSFTPAEPIAADTLVGYCNATDADADNIIYSYSIFKDDVLDSSSTYGSFFGSYTGEHWDTAAASATVGTGITKNTTHYLVVDSSDDEVYIYHSNGTYTGDSWDTNAPGVINPQGITMNDSHIFLVDQTGASSVQPFFLDGTVDGVDWPLHVENTQAEGLTMNGTHFFIADEAVYEMYVYELDGTYVERWNLDAYGLTDAQGVTTNGTQLFICDESDQLVYIFEFDGTYVSNFSMPPDIASGDGVGCTADTTEIAFIDSSDDEVYISSLVEETYASGVAMNIVNVSSGDTATYEKWNLQCTADDNTAESAALNSTAVFIDGNTYLYFNGSINGDLSSGMTCTANGTSVTATSTYYWRLPSGTVNLTCEDGTTWPIFSEVISISETDQTNLTINVTEYEAYLEFYDVETGEFLNNTNIALEWISDSDSDNLTTTDGTLQISPIATGDITLRYAASGYENTFYYFEVVPTQQEYRYNLTLLNNTGSSTGTITVKDTLNNELESAIVKILRYDVATNTFNVIQIVQTNWEGIAQATWTLNDEYYKFIIEYDGEVRLTTTPSYIYGTELEFFLDLGTEGFDDFFSENGLSGDVTWINASSTAAFTWNDVNGEATQGCVKAYRKIGSGDTLINETCTAGATGSNYVTITPETGKIYYFKGYVTLDGTDHLVDEAIVSFESTAPRQAFGMYILIFLEIIVILIGVYWMLELGIFLGTLFPMLFSIMRLINLELTATVPIFVLGLVAIAIIQLGRRRG